MTGSRAPSPKPSPKDRSGSKAVEKSPSKSPSKAAKSPSKSAQLREKSSKSDAGASQISKASTVADGSIISKAAAPPPPPPVPEKNKLIKPAIGAVVALIIIIVIVVFVTSGDSDSDDLEGGKLGADEGGNEDPTSTPDPAPGPTGEDASEESDGEDASGDAKQPEPEPEPEPEPAAEPKPAGLSKDCAEIWLKNEKAETKAASGPYDIKPSNTTGKKTVICDMTTDGGGWTVIQNRSMDLTDFARSYKEYEEGFGELHKSHWVGLKFINELTNAKHNSLAIVMKTKEGNEEIIVIYGKFFVDIGERKYKLSLSQYYPESTSKDVLSPNDGMEFTAKDMDNDLKQNKNCGRVLKGGFWYIRCGQVNLNGVFGKQDETGVYWGKQKLLATKLMIRPRACLSSPCRTASVCTNDFHNYKCDCSRGFEGKTCQGNFDECASNPCQAGSTCMDAKDGYTCSCPVKRNLRKCEGEMTNVAVMRPTFQSSTGTHDGSYAVDGNIVNGKEPGTDAKFFAGCSTTKWGSVDEAKPWWQVKLWKSYPICEIRILGQKYGRASDLKEFAVKVGNDKNIDTAELCHFQSSGVSKDDFLKIICEPARTGKYISIEQSDHRLSICEVQVMVPIC